MWRARRRSPRISNGSASVITTPRTTVTHGVWAPKANGFANDDGEPSSTAGKPILGQMLSHDLTDCLIVVVRYFGGTKLGVPGLIAAYKESAAAVIEVAEIVERTVDTIFKVEFPYVAMNEIMRIVKEEQPVVKGQTFDNLCVMTLAVRRGRADAVLGRLGKVEGVSIEVI